MLCVFSITATMLRLALLTLIVSVAGARVYTDEDLASFPKLFHLDEYERCLARVDGVYCLGTFELTPAEQPHPTYELMKAYSDDFHHHFNRTRIHRGYCVSSRSRALPTSDTTEGSQNASLLFEHVADHYAQRGQLRATLHTLHYCRTHADHIFERPRTNAEQLFLQVIFALVFANIVGTIYDVYVKDGPNKSKFLSAFSIPANWRRLTFIRKDGDPRQEALSPIEGLRVVALGFTTFAHANVFHFMFHTTNPEILEQINSRIDGVYLGNGTAMIQGFVMMTTFLTCYNLLIYSQKHELGLHLLPLCIIKRVVRITPVHLLIVGYAATWWIYSRDGPLVTTTIGLESEACKTKFWSHIFLLNNIVDANQYCVAPTWFLPVNMHMYILACTLTLLLWRRRTFALKIYAVLLFASCLMIGVIGYVKDYKPMIFTLSPDQLRRIFRETPSFTEFYISSWGALPACFLGLILAHVQFELDERKIKLSEYNWFVKLHYLSCPLMFAWSSTGLIARNYTSALFSAAHLALDRPIFCTLIAFTLLGLVHVNSPIGRFFSWKGWRIFGRMSLTVMMLHWCINMTIGARPMAYSTSLLDIIVDWSSTSFITNSLAVPITIMVEYPMQKFFETLFSI